MAARLAYPRQGLARPAGRQQAFGDGYRIAPLFAFRLFKRDEAVDVPVGVGDGLPDLDEPLCANSLVPVARSLGERPAARLLRRFVEELAFVWSKGRDDVEHAHSDEAGRVVEGRRNQEGDEAAAVSVRHARDERRKS